VHSYPLVRTARRDVTINGSASSSTTGHAQRRLRTSTLASISQVVLVAPARILAQVQLVAWRVRPL
jgi:hypothetical protein